MKTAYDIILRPVITEQSMEAVADKKYVFEVARDANKIEIRRAVEQIFGVKVLSVNTLERSRQGKRGRTGNTGRTAARKKAVIRLTEDSKAIEVFEGMV